MKKLLLILLLLTFPAYAANTTPPGFKNQLITNAGNGQYGAVSPGSLPLSLARSASTKWSAYYVVGDETANNNAFVPLNMGFGGIVARKMGAGPTYFTLKNFSTYDCDVVNQEIVPNINPSVEQNAVINWLPSANDPGYGAGNFTGHEADTNTCRLGGLTWMAIAKKYKIYAQAGCTPTGSWSNDSSYTGYYGLTSQTNGDSLSCPITTRGGPVYLWFLMKGSNGGTFTYSLDGGATTSVATQGNNLFTFPINTSSQTLGAVRIPVTTAGNHTIAVTVTSSTSSSNTVTIEGLGTPASIPYHGTSPAVFLGGQLLPSSNGPQAAAVAAFNTDQQTQANQLFADGLSVNFVDIQKYVNNNTTDYRTPLGNAVLLGSGQGHLAEAFSAAMQHNTLDGNIVNPINYGAACNAIYFPSSQISNPEYNVNMTAGSPVISIDNYTFQPGVATQTGGGDVGKRMCITGTGGESAGPCTYIASVNTSTNQATLGVNMPFTNTGIGRMGGYPTNPNDPSTAQDDTLYIQKAAQASLLGGGEVFLPTNCMVHNLILPQNVSLVGNGPSQFYNYGQTAAFALNANPTQSTILLCGLTGYPDDTQQCIQTVPHTRLSNFLINCGTFPFTPLGLSAAGIGYSTNSGSFPGGQILTDHLSYFGCPIDEGQAYGYNYDIAFTASITPNVDGVTSTMNVTSIDSTNFQTADNWTPGDFLALGRTVTGAGIPSGTTITAVPPTVHFVTPGQNPGNYTINKSLTLSSTGLVSPHISQLMEMRDSFSQHGWTGIGYNGDFTDSIVTDSVCTGNFQSECWRMGPKTVGVGNGGNRWIGGRMEEMALAAITCDGCQMFTSGLDIDFSLGFNVRTMGSNPSVQMTGGWMLGGGNCNTAAQDHAMISVGGSAAVVSVDGVQLGSENYAFCTGTLTNALFSTATGATLSNMKLSVTGGAASNNSTWGTMAHLFDWTNGKPAFYKQDTAGWPTIDTTQSAISIQDNGTIGFATAAGATTTGAILDMSGAPAAQSAFIFPQNTTGNRPTNVKMGMARYNTSTNSFEGYNGANWGSLAGLLPVLDNYIGGLILSNDPITPNTIIDIQAGTASSDDNTLTMTLPSSYSKTTSSWAVGSGNGCLDVGAVAINTWYNEFLIERTDTSVVDILCSTSAVSPTLPANYTKKRRLSCAFKTDGSSNIQEFYQAGSNPASCMYGGGMQTLDVNTALADTASHLITLNVPTNIIAQPVGSYTISGNAVLLSSGTVSALAPTTTNTFSATPGFSLLEQTTTGNTNTNLPYVITNSNAQIRVQATAATTTVAEITRGYIDTQTSIPAVPFLDGSVSSAHLTTQPGTVTLTTTSGHEPVFLWFFNDRPSGNNSVSSITDTAGLTWVKRTSFIWNPFVLSIEEWYAVTSAPLSSDVITVNVVGGPPQYTLVAFGVGNGDTTSVFDPNVGVPATANVMTGTSPISTTISTSHANDFLINGFQTQATSGVVNTTPSGFTPIVAYPGTSRGFELAYKVVPTVQSSATITDSWTGNPSAEGMLTDAVKGAGP